MPSFWDSDGNLIDQRIEVANSRYKDLSLVVDAANMAAGATVYSPWYDNAQWVRNIVALCSSDQQYDFVIQRRDNSLTGAFDQTLVATQTANPGSWRAHTQSGANGLAGFSARLGIKNSAAVSNTIGRLRVQFMGL